MPSLFSILIIISYDLCCITVFVLFMIKILMYITIYIYITNDYIIICVGDSGLIRRIIFTLI